MADGESTQLYEVIEPQAPLRRAPSPDASLDTEALRGERVAVTEITDEGWAHGRLESDGYVGFLPASALARPGPAPTHRVTALRALAFPGPSIRLPPVGALPLGARIAVAERFLNAPYLWGGKTSLGLDCSGLVQISLAACGIACPRDTVGQEPAFARSSSPSGKLQRGDLIFWEGHVAIVRDEATLIHANAFHMSVAIEPIAEAVERIRAADGEVTSVRRPANATQ